MSENDEPELNPDALKAILEGSAYTNALVKLQLGKDLSHEEEAALYKQTLEYLREREEKAISILRSGHGKFDERLRAAARYMGWVNDKKAGTYNGDQIFWEYLELIMGSHNLETLSRIDPISKSKAIEIITERHNFPSYEACYKYLSRYITNRREDGAHIPPILPR